MGALVVFMAFFMADTSALHRLRGGKGIGGKEHKTLGWAAERAGRSRGFLGKKGAVKAQTNPIPIDPAVVISKLMGIGIMGGSFFLKMPQIVKILSSKSVEGLSPMAVYHELPLYSSGVIYHYLQRFPLSTYGEMVVVMVQNIVIVLLMWVYQRPAIEVSEIVSKVVQFIAFCIVSLNLPKKVQPVLAFVNVPLLLSSCVPQILANRRQEHTGTLAISTCAMKALGSAMRLFTTVQIHTYPRSRDALACSTLSPSLPFLSHPPIHPPTDPTMPRFSLPHIFQSSRGTRPSYFALLVNSCR